MPIFVYEARDQAGKMLSGKRMAQNPDTLSVQLIKENIVPIHIISAEAARSRWQVIKERLLRHPVSLDELGMFARQMHALVKTGVPLAAALRHLADSMPNPTMKNTLYGVVEHLEAGHDLASAMQNYPVFSPIIISMVRVGQSGGNLAEAFLRINQYVELEGTAIRNVKTAMRYPTFVLVALCGAIVIINVFVIPAFANVFTQAKMELPLATRILINISYFFTHHWAMLLGGIVTTIALFFYYINSIPGRLKWDQLLLNIPVVGKMLRRIVLLRFSQSFSIMINSGIPLIEGIELIAQSVNNDYACQRILLMRAAIEHGNNLSQAAAATSLFSPLELQMLSVSEQTGELGVMLEQMATFYRREIDYHLKRLADTVEPLLIVVLSGVVLVLAFAVYLPIWNMTKLARMG